MAKELAFIEVKIEPAYYANYGKVDEQELHVKVKFRGQEYHHIEQLRQSDAVSVLDYCFDRAKYHINAMIKEKEK